MGRLKRALPKLMLTLLAACISLKPTEVRAEESLLRPGKGRIRLPQGKITTMYHSLRKRISFG